MNPWEITRRNSRLTVKLSTEADLSEGETEAIARDLEPQLSDVISEVVLDGPMAQVAMGTPALFRVIKRIGGMVTRHGKSFTVRSL